MNFIEFVAFVFTMFVMVWLMMRRVREAQSAAPEEIKDATEEEKEQLRQFMKSLNIEVEELLPKPQPPPPEPKVKQPAPLPRRESTPSIPEVELLQPSKSIHFYAYELGQNPSRIRRIVNDLPTRQQIMIIREVLSPPKGLQ